MNALLLRLLRVPHEPHPPDGSPESIRIFRAGRNYLRWRVLCWFAAQFGIAIVFLLFTLPPLAFVERTPPWVMDLITLAELLAILGFLAQLPVTFAAVRLDWELRWYIVTDRSLRIRAGLWSLQESTMSFANG